MIPEYKTILYATDLTPNATQAFRHAVGLAYHYNSHIHILHVLPEVETAVVNYVSTVMGKDMLAKFELEHKDEIRKEIQARLKLFAQKELEGHPSILEKIQVLEPVHGNPDIEILNAADRIDADIIVMGSHGKGALQRVLLGKVTERVLRKSSRPVLVSKLVE